MRLPSFIILLAVARIASAQSDTSCTGVFQVWELQRAPAFIGDMPAFYDYLGRNLQYPSDAMDARIEGKVYASFVVDVDGSIKDVSIVKGLSPSQDQEVMRVIAAMPRWEPGMRDCGPVQCLYNLPVSFTIHQPKDTLVSEDSTAQAEPIFDFTRLEVYPRFPGGSKAAKTWITANLHYPEDARAKRIEREVLVAFTVEVDGSRTDVRVPAPGRSDLDEEAVRLVRAMPAWEPGMIRRAPVRAHYMQRIVFQLD